MAAVPAGPAPVLPPAKIELPEDNGTGNPVGTRVVDTAYRFSDSDQIGEGTYGKVYVGFDNKTDKKVALKMIRMDTEKEGFPITAIREIKILSSLHHENIVNLREIVRSRVSRESNYKGAIYMVFDYAEHDLTGLLERTKYKITASQAKCILKQLLRGLSYCHINGILHRDLKASNLLIDSQGVLKIADFGLARPFQSQQDGKLTNRVITLWYRPPDLLLGADKYGPEVDMWSVGCIFAELLAAKPIFPGKDEQDQIHHIFHLMGAPSEQNWPGVSQLEFFKNLKKNQFPKDDRNFVAWCARHNVDPLAADLLKKMLTMDPKKRITAPDAQMHGWFTAEPKEGEPGDLPKVQDSHEWTMKQPAQKRRHEERLAAQQAQALGMPLPHGAPGQHHAGAANDRNVRQRTGQYAGHAGQHHQPQQQQHQQGYGSGGRGGYPRQQYPQAQVQHGGARQPPHAAPAAGMPMQAGYGVQAAPGYVSGGYGAGSRNQPPTYPGMMPAPRGAPGAGGYGSAGAHMQPQMPPQMPPPQGRPQMPPGYRPNQPPPGFYPNQR